MPFDSYDRWAFEEKPGLYKSWQELRDNVLSLIGLLFVMGVACGLLAWLASLAEKNPLW